MALKSANTLNQHVFFCPFPSFASHTILTNSNAWAIAYLVQSSENIIEVTSDVDVIYYVYIYRGGNS